MNQPTNTRIDQLVATAAEQSREVAQRRETATKALPPPIQRRERIAPLGLLPRWSVALTTILLLVSAGGTWALIQPSRAPEPAVVPPTLGEALEERASQVGPPPARRVVKKQAPRTQAMVREAAPRHVAKRQEKAPKAKIVAKLPVPEPTSTGGNVVFRDAPNGDVIIVVPKAKQKPLWTPADFGKYMRRRMGGAVPSEKNALK